MAIFTVQKEQNFVKKSLWQKKSLWRLVTHYVSFTISWRQKKVLFLEISQVKKFYRSPTCIVECVSEYRFLISKNKQTSKKKNNPKKAKETKEEKRISPENLLKKYFSHHPHFWKQEFFFLFFLFFGLMSFKYESFIITRFVWNY